MRQFAKSTHSIFLRCVRRTDRLLLIVGTALLFTQGIVITSLATNLPFSDGWTVLFSNSLERQFQWRWVWSLHNEHRLVWTKILHWLNYRYLGYSLIGQAAFNYALYVTFIWLFLNHLKREFQTPPGLMSISLASGLVWEIHFWGFQTHFILYPLCLLLALQALAREDRYSWWGVAWAAAGVYTMATGVIAAGCCTFFCAFRALLQPKFARRAGIQGLMIATSIIPWMRGFHKNPTHPDFAGPWTTSFWWHLGLTFAEGIGLGTEQQVALGGEQVGPEGRRYAWVGVTLFIVFLLLWVGRAWASRKDKVSEQVAWLALAAFSAAMLLSVGVTSMARAGLGGPTPRYCFPVVLLVPVYWTLLHYDWLKKPWHFAFVGSAILLPLLPHFQYVTIYRYANNIIDQHRGCIAAYYSGEGRGHCPGSWPEENLPELLERARDMQLPFTQDMIPTFQRYAFGKAVELPKSYCHVDAINNTPVGNIKSAEQPIQQNRTSHIGIMGWAWGPDRAPDQPDVAIEFVAGNGEIYALAAQRFHRPDLLFYPDASPTQKWGVFLDSEVPNSLPNGVYTVRVRQGRGDLTTSCELTPTIEIVD